MMKELIQRMIIGNSSTVLPLLLEKGEDGTYDLCVTSPPYWNLVEYKAGSGDLSMIKNEDDFKKDLTHIYKCVARLLNKRGTLASQWEDLTVRRPDGRTGEYMLSCINDAAEDAGMVLYARYIWKKFTKKPTVQYSTYDMAQARLARPNPSWSYLFIYKKDVQTDMSTNKTEVTREEWNNWGADAVWDFQNPGVNHHNTPFAPELVDRVLKLYTAPGDKVLEPFLGSGTTMRQCIENNRSCCGVELNRSYVNDIKKYVRWGQQSLAYKISYVYEDMYNI